jgi:hypothetical protein
MQFVGDAHNVAQEATMVKTAATKSTNKNILITFATVMN